MFTALALALQLAASAVQVPLISRPMTDHIVGIEVTEVFWEQAAAHAFLASPNEGALCIMGTFAPGDSLIRNVKFTDATIGNATPDHVFFGCPDSPYAVGIIHTHLLTAGERCGLSMDRNGPDDVKALEHSRYLFSVVLCSTGEAEFQMQDGRHALFRWHPSVATDSTPATRLDRVRSDETSSSQSIRSP